jgi:hypothetical protein
LAEVDHEGYHRLGAYRRRPEGVLAQAAKDGSTFKTLALSINHSRNIINAWTELPNSNLFARQSLQTTLRSWPIIMPPLPNGTAPVVRINSRYARGPQNPRITHQPSNGGRFWISLCGHPDEPPPASFIGMQRATIGLLNEEEPPMSMTSLNMRVIDTISLRTLTWTERVDPVYMTNQVNKWRLAHVALAADATMIAVITKDAVDLFDFAIR